MTEPYSQHFQAPPQLTERFLTWCLPKTLKEPVVGDLSEEFNHKIMTSGYSVARFWYLRQAALTAIQYLYKNKKGTLMFILGIFVFLGSFLMALWMSSHTLGTFINIPSIIVVLPPAIVLTIGITSLETCKNALRLMVDDELALPLVGLESAKQAYVVMGNTSMWLGVLGLIIGWVAMAEHIKAEEFSQVIGPATAVSLLTIMYSLIIKVLCYVGEQKIEQKIIQCLE